MKISLIVLSTILASVTTISVDKYLEKYGYKSENGFSSIDHESALLQFQSNFGLKQTGIADTTTLKMMQTPRCGVSDNMLGYAKTVSKWSKNYVTYNIQNFSPDLSKALIRRILRKAFDMWSAVTPLEFQEQQGKSDININFGSKTHSGCGSNYAFDGPGNVLAHAYYPEDGRLHFDEDEHFTDGTDKGIHLLSVAVHEIGHSIGLSHDSERGSIMYPAYLGYNPKLQLHSVDIKRIQAAYGKPSERECIDRRSDCTRLKNYCATHPDMKRFCRKTCGC